jgi:hypothetical protein
LPKNGYHGKTSAKMRQKHWLLSFIILITATVRVVAGEDEFLPLPQAAPPVVAPKAALPSGYVRPTITIKPPLPWHQRQGKLVQF